MFDENISVLVPYKPDGGHRDKNWAWIKKRYELLMPNAQICIGQYDGEPFSRSAAINMAAKMASKDIFIIADADVTFDVKQMEVAVQMLSDYVWVIPFYDRKELSEAQTDDLLKKDPSVTLTDMGFTNCGGHLYNVGSINIVPRKYFECVGGFDERFRGWGGEDNAFQMAMDTLCGTCGRPKQNTVWHLYHPQPVTKTYESPTYKANYDLFNRYVGSFWNKCAMQALIDERSSKNE